VKLSSKDVRSWLERETGSIFIPVHTKAQKLLNEMKDVVDDLAEVCRMLFENSAKEIEKRNVKTYKRARALNRLARLFLDRTRQIKVPDEVSYDKFNDFVQETQRAFAVTDVDVRNWFPRISPFFIIDRRRFQLAFERAKAALKELGSFVTKEYVKTKTLEETFQLINKLSAFENHLTHLKEQETKVRSEKALVERQITEIQQKMADMKSKGSMSQLNQTGKEIDVLSTEVKHSLQHLQKPFVKIQSLALHGEGSGLTPDEIKKLNQYLENPFEAFSTEQEDYPLLRQILQKLNRSMSDGKLKLKPEKVRKAQQLIDNILSKNSLADLHKKCVDATMRKAQLSSSAEVTEMQQNLSKLQGQLEDLVRKKGIVETEEHSIKVAHDETLDKIRNHKSEIEKDIFSFASKKVRIE
jgi:hypothetical protein